MLDTLVAMEVPTSLSWELIIVDNGSTDGTSSIVDTYKNKLPLTLVREDTAGLSFARNTGVATARGEYIVWTDDDVRVDPDWLAAYARAFARHPDGAFFGGHIDPVFTGDIPAWLTRNMDVLGSAFAERDLGEKPRAFTDDRHDVPYGANFAVRGKEQRKFAYPTYLGVSPKFRRVGEETYVTLNIKMEGGIGYWVPEAKVKHIIPEKRQSLDYIFEYNRSQGETWAVLTDRNEQHMIGEDMEAGNRRVRNVPVWLLRKVWKSWLNYKIASTFKRPEAQFKAIETYGFHRGAIDYFKSARD